MCSAHCWLGVEFTLGLYTQQCCTYREYYRGTMHELAVSTSRYFIIKFYQPFIQISMSAVLMSTTVQLKRHVLIVMVATSVLATPDTLEMETLAMVS